MLFIPLIEKQKIAGLRLIDLLADKLTIALDQRQGGDEGFVLAINIAPVES